MKRKGDYLRLEKLRDVTEMPLDGVLDINGWDLQKTLRLLYRSNPTVFEWFSSPVVYMETPFADTFRKVMQEYFSAKRSLYHYLSMAEGNYREYLKDDEVKIKKYFYVLRPVLACRWVIDKGTQPPMLFSELADAQLPDSLLPDVDRLFNLKIKSPEVKMIPRIDRINKYLDEEIARIKSKLKDTSDDRQADWRELNALFLQNVG